MPKYLTVQQYKNVNTGMSLSDVNDFSLAHIIGVAEGDIDAHMGFDAKRGGFEPHTITVQHPFQQDSLKTLAPMTPIPFRNVQRYRIQVSNISTSGAGFFANISPADCVINNDGQYVEIVPLQAVTYSLSPILIQLGLRPPIVEIDAEIGFYIPAYSQPLYSLDSSNTTYYALHGFWASTYTLALHLQPAQLQPVPPVIYVNGVVRSSGYTINYNEGSVVFSPALQSTDIVTADATKTIPDFVRNATIYQTSYILGQRALNKSGLNGLELARTGDQDVRRPRIIPYQKNTRPAESVLCKEALDELSSYEVIGIA